ncbi:MAG TPA: hypothetical protein VH137_03125 [Gemmatimonadales bacterium]|nr:hypothetical protein [Gemmatimonadales bacterium]
MPASSVVPPSPTGPAVLVPLPALPVLLFPLPAPTELPLLLPLPWPLSAPLAPLAAEPELVPPPSGGSGVPLSEPLQCVSATGPAIPRSAIPTNPACLAFIGFSPSGAR